ncbi:MAG: hypothetical protein ABI851_09420 [Saprospiraceae bacterium]
MNKEILPNFIRISLLILFQVLILREINLESSTSKYFNILIYQFGIMLLPVATPSFIVFLIAFLSGLIVDNFYNSIGVHASACLWMAACRVFVLKYLEPKSGYTINQKPSATSLGMFWFLQYTSILTITYLLTYFILDVFTLVYFGQILLKTIGSFTISILVILLIYILINPKE